MTPKPNEDSLENVILKCLPKMTAIACSIVGDWSEAQDIAHDVVTKMLLTNALEGAEDPEAFLVSSTIHRALDDQKSARNSRRGSSQIDDMVPDQSTPNPYQQAALNDYRALVLRYLNNLPPEQLLIIWLHIWRELTFAEIAKVMDLPSSTVQARYYRTLKVLKKEMSQDEEILEFSI